MTDSNPPAAVDTLPDDYERVALDLSNWTHDALAHISASLIPRAEFVDVADVDMITAAAALIRAQAAEIERMGEWHLIEMCDHHGQEEPCIVGVTGGGRNPVVGEAWRDDEEQWWWAGTSPGDYFSSPIHDIQHGTVTHWRPLPPPPTSDGEAG